ncbi:phage integrase family protein [Clostridium botulinum 202F]|uniref:Phage integrase family site-specific recombinase n=1 Tax=Clostridium botulinum TaxID=1491 RepID=R4NED8_CLOBO|nr:phage integrase family site-specific recombinase [Clostridium botulinum]AIY81746.1 phage integrase family protein [Clostridium botulinum 202F]AGL45043.1 phage integrase family site-specific recombinase [Clostridium botulinum]AGL45083.1 phage integrase family site-specific recombinase [Clostridium botulinum]AGL45123.1 phage integrase family site-specific recombinase [Clostridium botulinum]
MQLNEVQYDDYIRNNIIYNINNAIDKRMEYICFDIDKYNKFENDIWDFNYENRNKRSLALYRVNFSNIREPFKKYCKILVLKEIKIKKVRISTCVKIINILKYICDRFYDLKIINVKLLNIVAVKSYFNECKDKNKPSMISKSSSILNKLVKVIEDIEKIDLSEIKKYLSEITSTYSKIRPYTAINEYIPDIFLNQIVSVAMKDIDDSNLNYPTRLVACLIVILANTGMRAEELSLLERNKLTTIKAGDKEVDFIEFLTFKTVGRGKQFRRTSCFLSEDGGVAYEKAEKLVDEFIDNLSKEIKEKVLYYFYSGKYIRNKKFLPKKYVDELKELPQNKIDEFTNEAKRYLYLGRYGLLIRGTAQLRNSVKKFFVRHRNDFDLSALNSQEKTQIRYYSINSQSVYEYVFNFEERKKITFENAKNLKIPYAGLHQFRITVCTKLFMQGVHIDYILKHMNHLSEDMTVYYNKSETFINELEESIKLISDITKDNGHIETNINKIDENLIDEYSDLEIIKKIKKVNEFLEKNNININKDMHKIIKILLKTNTTIEENEFGMCIRSIINGICDRKKYFSSINDNYYVGIQLDNYKFIKNHYERFVQKKEVIEHNKKIADKDSRFTNEYQREVKALTYYVDKTLNREVELLEDDIDNHGIENIIERYPDLKNIINNIEEIKKDLSLWKKEY